MAGYQRQEGGKVSLRQMSPPESRERGGWGVGGERGDYWRRRIGADIASAPSAEERLRCNALSACARFCDFMNL